MSEHSVTNDPRDLDSDLAPDLAPDERERLIAVAQRLQAERPVPRPAFRGDLRRRLIHDAPPRALRARIAALAVSGAVLLLVAAMGALGAGPLKPAAQPSAPAAAAVDRPA